MTRRNCLFCRRNSQVEQKKKKNNFQASLGAGFVPGQHKAPVDGHTAAYTVAKTEVVTSGGPGGQGESLL